MWVVALQIVWVSLGQIQGHLAMTRLNYLCFNKVIALRIYISYEWLILSLSKCKLKQQPLAAMLGMQHKLSKISTF